MLPGMSAKEYLQRNICRVKYPVHNVAHVVIEWLCLTRQVIDPLRL